MYFDPYIYSLWPLLLDCDMQVMQENSLKLDDNYVCWSVQMMHFERTIINYGVRTWAYDNFARSNALLLFSKKCDYICSRVLLWAAKMFFIFFLLLNAAL